MRPMLAVTAGASLLLIAAGSGWAGGKVSKSNKSNRSNTTGGESAADAGKDKETPASFNKTFQWEDKVVGPKTNRIDHDKIAAMQEQGRREDAAKRREPPKKAEHAAPAVAKLPTMDIEKPMSMPARSPVRKAAYTQPKQHDALDNLLAENGVGASDD
ncbi:MAG TPA: hypothetical protein VH560_18145, partial [Polyangia bacterium]|nr:hypothetical protein [Polyangia bacterium]